MRLAARNDILTTASRTGRRSAILDGGCSSPSLLSGSCTRKVRTSNRTRVRFPLDPRRVRLLSSLLSLAVERFTRFGSCRSNPTRDDMNRIQAPPGRRILGGTPPMRYAGSTPASEGRRPASRGRASPCSPVDRTPPSEGGDHGFEPRQRHWTPRLGIFQVLTFSGASYSQNRFPVKDTT